MRALPIAVTALAAALALTACDSGGGTHAKSSAAAPSKKPSSTACQADGVAVKVGPANAATTAGDTGNVPVTLTNRGTAACTLKGFPGVELSDGKSSWPVAEQQQANPVEVTLQPSEATTFTIAYVRGPVGGEKSAAVKTLKFDLSGGGKVQSSPWTYGDVALKTADAADASVSPFQQAGD